MTDRETWLQSIRANPSDWQAMLVFADWLEDTEGDLLAAEQWRIIALLASHGFYSWVNTFPSHHINPMHYDHFMEHRDIRCMPTYPLTIEDVQACLKTAR